MIARARRYPMPVSHSQRLLGLNEAIEQIDEIVSELLEQASALRNRLHSVLIPEPVESPEDRKIPQQTLCPEAEEILYQRVRGEECLAILLEIAQRLKPVVYLEVGIPAAGDRVRC